MLNVGKLAPGGESYYLDTVASGQEEYYTGAGEAAGTWTGDAAALGLAGDVTPGDLHAVLGACDPRSGQRLQASSRRRIPGFDLAFRAPKSVSLIWALGPADTVNAIWEAAYWPTVGLLAALLLTSLYHFAVPLRTPWRRDLPGAALAMVVWLLGSVGLRSYTSATIETDAAYQAVAAPLIVLLWLYLIGFATLLGAELNAEIEKMWPTKGWLAPDAIRD